MASETLIQKLCETPSKLCRGIASRLGLSNDRCESNVTETPRKNLSFMPFNLEELMSPKKNPMPSRLVKMKSEVRRGFLEGFVTETLSSMFGDNSYAYDICSDASHLAIKAILVDLVLGLSNNLKDDKSSQNPTFQVKQAIEVPRLSSKVLVLFIWPLFIRSISHTAPALALHLTASEMHNIMVPPF